MDKLKFENMINFIRGRLFSAVPGELFGPRKSEATRPNVVKKKSKAARPNVVQKV